jgi:hypothetical protein
MNRRGFFQTIVGFAAGLLATKTVAKEKPLTEEKLSETIDAWKIAEDSNSIRFESGSFGCPPKDARITIWETRHRVHESKLGISYSELPEDVIWYGGYWA